jgi:ParE toxin of type II toxin-antitoxin system, parDE
LIQLAALPDGAADRLREYLHGDYLILYTVASAPDLVHLLSVRHHRELSFQFARLWPGDAGAHSLIVED